MAKNDNLGDFLTDIANAIREKKGTSGPINAQDFNGEIRELAGLSTVEKVSHTNLSNYMTEIANTLREVEGSSALINAQDFSQKILDIATDETSPLYFEALEVPTTIQFSNSHEYSYDNNTWNSGTSETSVSLQVGQKVYYRASGLTATSSDGIGRFTITNKCNVGGNIMSMLYGADFKDKFTLTQSYSFFKIFSGQPVVSAKNLSMPATVLASSCYRSMFYQCVELVEAPKLPATTLAENCYRSLFNGCSKLETAPELPATILKEFCYSHMFHGCISLTTAPKLPATTLAEGCYQNMFYYCTGLITAPELPATTLAPYCYDGMFWSCDGLTTAPELPATTLAEYCYSSMFCDCTNLTTAPDLPATILVGACYDSMFYGCTSLVTAPDLPARVLTKGQIGVVTIGCYNNMFYGCTKLKYIKAMFVKLPKILYTANWLKNVAPIGVFVKNSAATWNVTGISGVPEGWTVETASA